MGPLFAAIILLLMGSIGLGILLAIPCFFFAQRLGQSSTLFVILSLIPVVNLLFFFVVGVMILLHIMDKLNAIAPQTPDRS